MEKAELVFVTFPLIGHLVSTVELAKLLLNRDHRLSITLLIMNLPFNSMPDNTYTELLNSSSNKRIRFIDLPKDEQESPSDPISLCERQKTHVKEAVSKLINDDSLPPRLVGFVLDMFCVAMIDVANEFGVPSYLFYASGAAFLGFIHHVQVIHDEHKFDPLEFKDSDAELVVPSLVNPFPARVMPSVLLGKGWLALLDNARRFKEIKGIMVNTFFELESYAIESLKSNVLPPVYPVGPILKVKDVGSNGIHKQHEEIMQWLDDQPPLSVAFLCFGSMGSFNGEQVREIAYALEHSGHRFLWSLRRPPPNAEEVFPSDYEDPQEILPEEFLNRTAKHGKVIGWAPQGAILAHPAIGGFVSHNGWNSVLESIWYSVPIATWPIYAEQQFIAFEMVIELGLAVEVKMDYRKDDEAIVNSNEIEKAIRNVMETDSEIRKKVKKMSEKSKIALMNGGSSFISLDRLIKNMMDNVFNHVRNEIYD